MLKELETTFLMAKRRHLAIPRIMFVLSLGSCLLCSIMFVLSLGLCSAASCSFRLSDYALQHSKSILCAAWLSMQRHSIDIRNAKCSVTLFATQCAASLSLQRHYNATQCAAQRNAQHNDANSTTHCTTQYDAQQDAMHSAVRCRMQFNFVLSTCFLYLCRVLCSCRVLCLWLELLLLRKTLWDLGASLVFCSFCFIWGLLRSVGSFCSLSRVSCVCRELLLPGERERERESEREREREREHVLYSGNVPC